MPNLVDFIYVQIETMKEHYIMTIMKILNTYMKFIKVTIFQVMKSPGGEE